MALNKVRVQLLNSTTDEVLQEVDVLTSADAVTFADGQTFQQKLDSGVLKGNTGATGPQGVQGIQGEPFSIAKTYVSIALMNAGYATDGIGIGKFVMIDTGNVNDTDNAKLYVKGSTAYNYITDLSGVTGVQGPQGVQGIQGPQGDTGATGPQGVQGIKGDTGAAGTDGKTIWNGTSDPTSSVGSNGDFYINTSSSKIFGPKASGTWPSGVSIIGPQGPQGQKGDTGATGAQGPKGDPGDALKYGTTYDTASTVKVFLKQV